jgi:two-component system, OmpR family, response regulator
MRILLIEDDPDAAEFVAQGLAGENYSVEVVGNGREGLLRAAGEDWDLLIVDRMLPDLDGLAMVRTLRSAGVMTPVLFLTTMGGIDDRVTGLNAGGDDYLVKPFAFAELAARVAALGRRLTKPGKETVLRVDDLELDLLARTVKRGGRKVELQPREFLLLEYLVRHAGEVVTRTMLLENVWHFHFDPGTNIVESHMSRLRGKVDQGRTELIQTVRGAGYRVRAPG